MSKLEDTVKKLTKDTDRVIKNANTREEDVGNSIKHFDIYLKFFKKKRA